MAINAKLFYNPGGLWLVRWLERHWMVVDLDVYAGDEGQDTGRAGPSLLCAYKGACRVRTAADSVFY